jgi:hypothetical protein
MKNNLNETHITVFHPTPLYAPDRDAVWIQVLIGESAKL